MGGQPKFQVSGGGGGCSDPLGPLVQNLLSSWILVFGSSILRQKIFENDHSKLPENHEIETTTRVLNPQKW